MTPRVYTLAGGGWLVTRGERAVRAIGPLPEQHGHQTPLQFAATLRLLADDIERAGQDGPRFEGDQP